jgi:hypothetical protein
VIYYVRAKTLRNDYLENKVNSSSLKQKQYSN